uniref:Ovule protein n=1 Tax=Steinernema glaseri TaxID=37863 RepID=A0A1I8AW57_9BILA
MRIVISTSNNLSSTTSPFNPKGSLRNVPLSAIPFKGTSVSKVSYSRLQCFLSAMFWLNFVHNFGIVSTDFSTPMFSSF